MAVMVRPIEQFVRTLKASRRVSTPVVGIRNADPALTVTRIVDAVGKEAGSGSGTRARPLQVNEPGGRRCQGTGTDAAAWAHRALSGRKSGTIV